MWAVYGAVGVGGAGAGGFWAVILGLISCLRVWVNKNENGWCS